MWLHVFGVVEGKRAVSASQGDRDMVVIKSKRESRTNLRERERERWSTSWCLSSPGGFLVASVQRHNEGKCFLWGSHRVLLQPYLSYVGIKKQTVAHRAVGKPLSSNI